ncbi:hypothetical protein [Mycolicibacterium brisbanense]|uniref:Growth/differentiation factor n=1 Tax=Mycolicibacterium brisbanense TaxID=146020 RepID=A0A100W065_9MYCO|nr:hypothetical protein [Mycolicibacterium brisbanense]MCV7156392.1 growth/differentiation factor [Mycolicibacterium brisbanense]GAS89183.1 uncharacterized protein, precursor [Mycolicibacterium brisbanense]
MDISMLSMAVDIVASSHHHSSSSSSGGSEWIPFLFLLTGPAFFMYQYSRYRNKNKRHHHERETLSEIANMQAMDQFAQSVTNSRDSRMSGANEREVLG